MIDAASILFTTCAVLFVAVRAIVLDRRVPWFTRAAPEPAERDRSHS